MKKTVLALLAVICLALSALHPASAQAAAILVNGSFEDGPSNGLDQFDVDVFAGSLAIAGWEVFGVGATGGAVDHLNTPWDVSDGVHAIDLDGRDSVFGGVRQNFATIAGQRYDVAFDLSGNPVGGPLLKQLLVTVGDFSEEYTHDSTGQTRENLAWDLILFSFIATGPTSTLSFMSLTGSPNSYGALIDNVRLTVPEPGMFLLVTLGVVARAMRRRIVAQRG